ncbi:MAG: hypothetical protein H6705_03700 [Myxococcales bacterium]|nr:hypothetical protein [Myxococcales bacterium]
MHYRADGVLLYDADDDTLRAVDFPLPRPARRLLWFALGLLAGVALAALLAAGRVAGWIGR